MQGFLTSDLLFVFSLDLTQNGFFSQMKTKLPVQYSAEDVFDFHTFLENPSLFYSAARFFTSFEDLRPTVVHRWLQQIQSSLLHVVTQNIDGLEAGLSCPVTYLHGLLSSGVCLNCKKVASKELLYDHYRKGTVAYCSCGVQIFIPSSQGVIKPDIVFYNEAVSAEKVNEIEAVSKDCDLLLVMGTSFSTYPVSDFLRYFESCDIIVLNQTSINLPKRSTIPLSLQVLGSFHVLFSEVTREKKDALDNVVSGKWIYRLPVQV